MENVGARKRCFPHRIKKFTETLPDLVLLIASLLYVCNLELKFETHTLEALTSAKCCVITVFSTCHTAVLCTTFIEHLDSVIVAVPSFD